MGRSHGAQKKAPAGVRLRPAAVPLFNRTGVRTITFPSAALQAHIFDAFPEAAAAGLVTALPRAPTRKAHLNTAAEALSRLITDGDVTGARRVLFDDIAEADETLSPKAFSKLLLSAVASAPHGPHPAAALASTLAEYAVRRGVDFTLTNIVDVASSFSLRADATSAVSVVQAMLSRLTGGFASEEGRVYFSRSSEMLVSEFCVSGGDFLDKVKIDAEPPCLTRVRAKAIGASQFEIFVEGDTRGTAFGRMFFQGARLGIFADVVITTFGAQAETDDDFFVEATVTDMPSCVGDDSFVGRCVVTVAPRSFSPRLRHALMSRLLRVDSLAARLTTKRQLVALANVAMFAQPGASAAALGAPLYADTPHAFASPVDEHVGAILIADPEDRDLVRTLCDAPIVGNTYDGGHWPDVSLALASRAAGGALNATQRAAVVSGLTQRVTIVRGPPGTGKTATAVALILAWVEAGFGPILATADSNTAVDNLLAGLVRAGMRNAWDFSGADSAAAPFVVRAGSVQSRGLSPYALNGSVWDAARNQMVSREAFYARRGRWKGKYEEMRRAVFMRAHVVCATTSVAGAGQLASFGKLYGAVLVDEAAQVTEPSVAVALATSAPRVVALFGDDKQLPPTVLSRFAKQHGLSRTLFERLRDAGARVLLLDTQYRMHPAIAAFSNAHFYGGRLRSGVRAADRRPPAGFTWPLSGVGIAFAKVSGGAEVKHGTSFRNREEIAVVCDIVTRLLAGREIVASEIGVVTPYAAQKTELQRQLPHGVVCDTVDGFQGRELDAIIFSVVRANEKATLGSFVDDARRLNVALTRARRALVVVGDEGTMAGHGDSSPIGAWLSWARAASIVSGAYAVEPAVARALTMLDVDADVEVRHGEGLVFVAEPAPAELPPAMRVAPLWSAQQRLPRLGAAAWVKEVTNRRKTATRWGDVNDGMMVDSRRVAATSIDVWGALGAQVARGGSGAGGGGGVTFRIVIDTEAPRRVVFNAGNVQLSKKARKAQNGSAKKQKGPKATKAARKAAVKVAAKATKAAAKAATKKAAKQKKKGGGGQAKRPKQ